VKERKNEQVTGLDAKRRPEHYKIVAARERYERYCELRDEGMEPSTAGIEIGISETSWKRYERGYRRLHGLPDREPGWQVTGSASGRRYRSIEGA
jgi:hypothetical protein